MQIVLQATAFSTVSLGTGTPCQLYNVIFENSPYLTQNAHSNSAETTLAVTDLRRLVVGNGCYNRVPEIDFSGCAALQKIRVGKFSLCMLSQLELRGLPELESVEIGAASFAKQEGRFGLNACESVKEVRIGSGSFASFSECVVEEVDSLEVLAMGELTDENGCFVKADLQLESRCVRWW